MGVEAGSSLHEHPSQDGLEAVEERADKITDEGGSGQAQGSKIPGFWWNWPTCLPKNIADVATSKSALFRDVTLLGRPRHRGFRGLEGALSR